MKSPFPGMDPYLEVRRGDVHTSLITYARDQLQGQMPSDLRVRVEEFEPTALETKTQRWLQVIDTHSGNRVITVLEFLRPTKQVDVTGSEQQELRAARVNLVEIDLLTDRISVVRASRPQVAEMYRVSLRERLPIIRVPLRETDPDAHLDIQELIDKAYENGGYDVEIDYRVDPFPPLQGDDADWADALLREKKRR